MTAMLHVITVSTRTERPLAKKKSHTARAARSTSPSHTPLPKKSMPLAATAATNEALTIAGDFCL